MIILENLHKTFAELEAVSELSFSIAEGEVVGLLGPNGAGKTTTMRMLTTFLPPSGGTASVAGFDVLKEASEVRKHIGYLPESPPLYMEMRVDEYLSFVGSIKGLSRKLTKERLEELIEQFSLSDVRERLCGQLSKGFKQRVGLAAALIHQPKVLILDEPTSGLDPAQMIEIRKLIKELKGKHTVILSTHLLPEVVETCSQVIIISRGRVVEQGAIEEMTKDGTLEEKFLEAVS